MSGTGVPAATTLLEVLGVVRVVGVGHPADLNMALDGRAGGCVKGEYWTRTVSLGPPDAEEPRFSRRREVLASLPGGRLVRVASFGPAQQLPEDVMVQPVKGPLGGSMPIIIGPTPDEGVEFEQERLLGEAQGGLDAEPDFIPHRFDVTLGGSDQEFIPEFAHGVPQKVEPLADVGDDGLLL